MKIDSKIMCLFYNSVISSVLVYGIPSWFEACDKKLRKLVTKFHDKMCKITDKSVYESIEHPRNVYRKKCINLITKMLQDQDHVMHQFIHVLPHGNLQTVKCNKERFRSTFLPVAIKLYNAK